MKYVVTEIGEQELNENAYVPYMHSNAHKTTEYDRFRPTFNVWTINKLLGTDDKTNWKNVVEEMIYKQILSFGSQGCKNNRIYP